VGAILGSDRVILSTSSRVVVLRLSDGLPLSEYAPVDSAGASGIPAPRLHWLSTPVLGADGTIYVADPGLRYLCSGIRRQNDARASAQRFGGGARTTRPPCVTTVGRSTTRGGVNDAPWRSAPIPLDQQ